MNGRSWLTFSAVLTVTACGTAEPPPPPPSVRTIIAGEVAPATLTLSGTVRARYESDLGFRVGGKIVERYVDAGQHVRAGQRLMRLDASDLALGAAAAGERVRAADADATRAAADERRLRGLVEAGAISASAYDTARASARATAANLAAARSTASDAANQRGYSLLVADTDGVVMSTAAEPGQVVTAGTPVLRLARNGVREAVVDIPESRLADVPKAGTATLIGDPRRYTARLRVLSAAADPMTRAYTARYVLSGAGAAPPPLGASVALALPSEGISAVIAVPLTAVYDDGRGPGVWVVRNNNSVSLRRVRVASFADDSATLAGSVHAGERVVSLGAQLLREGQVVRLAADNSR